MVKKWKDKRVSGRMRQKGQERKGERKGWRERGMEIERKRWREGGMDKGKLGRGRNKRMDRGKGWTEGRVG